MKVLFQEKDMHQNDFPAVEVMEVDAERLTLEVATQILANFLNSSLEDAVAYMKVTVETEGGWVIVAGEETSFYMTNLDALLK